MLPGNIVWFHSIKNSFSIICTFLTFLFYAYQCFDCTYTCVSQVCLGLREGQFSGVMNGYELLHFPGTQVQPPVETLTSAGKVLGTKPVYSVGATSSLNC